MSTDADLITLEMTRAAYDLLRDLFAQPAQQQLQAELAERIAAYEAAKTAVTAAQAEVTRRQHLDDHDPRFNDPITVTAMYPNGRFSPLNLRNKMLHVAEAESDVADAKYRLETATFHLQRIRKAIEDAK